MHEWIAGVIWIGGMVSAVVAILSMVITLPRTVRSLTGNLDNPWRGE